MTSDFDMMVVEMRKAARENPMDPAGGVLPDQGKITREFEYEGYPVRAKLTIDKLVDRWAWHVSITRHADTPMALPDSIIESIASRFLPGKRMEIPSAMYPGVVRKFVQLTGEYL